MSRTPEPDAAFPGRDVPRPADRWADGDAYEAFMGAWSRLAAERFVAWLDLPGGLAWLDVGCGTGALSEVVLARASPARLVGVDASPGYVAHAAERLLDPRARFEIGDAGALPAEDASFDVAVSGLMLNFVAEPGSVLREMARVVRPGGRIAAYVWDYAEGMEMLRHFWDAAVALDPAASALDEGRRFPLCRPDALRAAFEAAGLHGAEVSALEVPARFSSFDAYWSPFLGGQGPAPGYVTGLPRTARDELRERVRARVTPRRGGSIRMRLRAWAARALVP